MDGLQVGEQASQTTASASPLDLAASLELDNKLRAAIQLLPSCQRCKRLRRKCDTRLPSYKLCLKAGVKCSFYDHSLQQVLPRSYVLSLLKRAQELKSTKDPKTTLPHVDRSPEKSIQEPISPFDGSRRSSINYDDHFMLSTTSDRTFRFSGSSSVFVLTVQLATQVFDDPTQFGDPERFSNLGMMEEGINDSGAMVATRISMPTKEMLSTLIGHYTSTMNTLYPLSTNQ